ncbi:hypothetical protein J2T09_004827 [Neorhizobium huautlense]|uniref:Uncharacterized protein n=1 Tax=Neorhizobium huautlense TaxID=67774 RepID=A0ABT9Q007_9HYPH|nr:hypothetical protein [Neorhizobium huautlense]MDP9840047.1 hypothetical protein [Neorhizobium huautlense]
MPGVYKSLFILAFDLDRSGQAIPVSEPKLAPDETAAIAEARRLEGLHAGVVVWKREAKPVIGEEGEPEILWQAGALGDFN